MSGEGFVAINRNDQFFMMSSTFLLILGLVSLVLVRLELFSLSGVGIVSVLLFALLYHFGFSSLQFCDNRVTTGHDSAEKWVVVSLAVLVAVVYGVFPTYFLDGGRDHGLYLMFSQYIAKTGGLNLEQPWMRDLHKHYEGVFLLKYPGIYSASEWGLSHDRAKLIPQFMHLFPAFGALAGALAGIEGIVRTNTVIVFFALWAVYKTGLCFMSRWGALATVGLLALNPALLWVGRSTFTEPLQIFIFFLSFFMLFKAIASSSSLMGAAAGFILGTSVLNRISGLLGGTLILATALYVALYYFKARHIVSACIWGYLISSSMALLDGYCFSFPYLAELWQQGSLKKLLGLHGLVLIGSLILVKIKLKGQARRCLAAIVSFVMLFLLLGVFVWVAYRGLGYADCKFDFSLRSAAELSWYLSWPVIGLAFLAVAQSIRNKNHIESLMFHSVMLFTVFIYTWRPSISPDHYWASRRWLSFCIPMILLASIKALCGLAPAGFNRRTLIKTVVFLAVAVFTITSYGMAAVHLAGPFFSTSLLAGYPDHYAELAGKLKEKNQAGFPYVTDNGQAAGILTFLYDVPTVLLSEKGRRLLSAGRLQGLPSLGLLSCSEVKMKDVRSYCFSDLYTERCQGRVAEQLVPYAQKLIPGITADPAGKGRVVELGALFFPGQVGVRDEKNMVLRSLGESGMLQFGPYFSLPQGKYRVSWAGRLDSLAEQNRLAYVDVVCNCGKDRLTFKNVTRQTRFQTSDGRKYLVSLEFELKETVSDLEYRFWVDKGVLLELDSIKLECLD